MPKQTSAECPPAPLFKAFCEASQKEFEFLTSEFGFTFLGVTSSAFECSLKYESGTTGIAPFYEIGTLPTVYLSKLQMRAGKLTQGPTYAIEYLASCRCPDRATVDLDPATLNIRDFSGIMKSHASLLRDHGSDILLGDCSVFGTLKRLARRPIR